MIYVPQGHFINGEVAITDTPTMKFSEHLSCFKYGITNCEMLTFNTSSSYKKKTNNGFVFENRSYNTE